ncbi:MAG: glycosyltransferase family 4 protein [Chitinophagaceae bacterium]
MANVLGLVSFKVFPTHMGGQKGVAHFYDYLSKHHSVFIAASKDNQFEDGKINFFPALASNEMILLNFFTIRKLQKIIQQHNIQCIIAEHSYTGWVGLLLKRKTNIPFIIHSHNLESYRFKQMGKWWWKLYWMYEKWIHKKADHNFFISEEDMSSGIKEFELNEKKCSVITYGVDKIVQKKEARDQLKRILGIGDEAVLLFNGTLNYKPNIDAVRNLLRHVDLHLQKKNLSYNIVITGSQATASLQKQMADNQRCIYTGFVADIDLYYQGADLFLNAVNNDSGIKTKVVEALANSCTVISTEAGAAGLRKEVCGNKLIIVPDKDWNIFAHTIIENLDKTQADTPSQFYQYYSWKNITAKASEKIEEVIKKTG